MGTSTRRRARRRAKANAQKRGLPPGAAVYVGEAVPDTPVRVEVMDYDGEGVREPGVGSLRELVPMANAPTVTWINLDGVHEVEQVTALGRAFGLHPLWVEDVLNPSTRPKAEVLGGHLLLIVRMASMGSEGVEAEQIAIVLGDRWVLTFQERPGDVFASVRERVRAGGGRIRTMGADYLAHALLDAIVDNYFLVLEHIETQVDVLEDAVMGVPGLEFLPRIHAMKQEIAQFRQIAWPMREAIANVLSPEAACISEEARPFYRDLYDHVVQVMDVLEASRDRLIGVVELSLALASHRMNEVMKVLTIVATVFIPLTFVAGVYGMNFDYMPELGWRWGYPAVMAFMFATAVAMIVWFRTRKWM